MMFLSQSKNIDKNSKIQKYFEKLALSFGYSHRVGGYYVIREDDGYINIHREFPSKKIYNFHKNFYQGVRNPHHDGSKYEIEIKFSGYNCTMTPSTISVDFNNVSDFENFLANYHKKQGRKLKLKQIKNVNLS